MDEFHRVRAAMIDPVHEAISAAVGDILEPLAKLAMEMQIGASEFVRLIEQAFIRAIDHDASAAGRSRPGASAIAARSGLTRQRVSQLRKMNPARISRTPERQPQTLRILSAWKTDSKFFDRDGLPRILPIRGPISFGALVKRHGSGIRARSILRELESLKSVRFTKNGDVEMIDRPDLHVVRRAQGIRDLGEFGREFLETLSHNISNPEAPRYHRRVVGEHVKREEVPRLVRDASSQAGVLALALQDAITDSGVTVKAGPKKQEATRLSAHFFLCERASVVPTNPRVIQALSGKRRRTKRV